MSWNKAAKRRFNLVRRLDREFKREVKRSEKDLSARLQSFAARLVTDDQGNIRPNVANMSFNRSLNKLFDEYSKDQEKGLIAKLIDSVNKILVSNRRYFNEVKRGGPHAEVAKRILQSLGYNNKTKKIIPGSWLDQIRKMNEVRTSFIRRLAAGIVGGIAINLLLDQIDRLFNGLTGLFNRWIGRATNDVFIEVDRQAQLYYAKKLGLRHAYYAGTIKDNTRPFCRARSQNVYTLDVIDSWQPLEWAGKIVGEDVKIVCGGYNCRHHLSWVTEEIAKAIGQINVFND